MLFPMFVNGAVRIGTFGVCSLCRAESFGEFCSSCRAEPARCNSASFGAGSVAIDEPDLFFADHHFTARRRFTCGVFCSWPVLSSHLAPGFAPQVGQRLASIRFVSRFFIQRVSLF